MIKFKIASKIGILASVLVLVTALVIGKVAVQETIRYNIENEVEITYRDKLIVDKVPFCKELINDLVLDLEEEVRREIIGRVIYSHLAKRQELPVKGVDELEDPRRKPWEADWEKVVLGESVWQATLRNNQDYLDLSLFDIEGNLLLGTHRLEEGSVAIAIPGTASRQYRSFIQETLASIDPPSGILQPEKVHLSSIGWGWTKSQAKEQDRCVPIIRVGGPVYFPSKKDFAPIPESFSIPEGREIFGVLCITMNLERIVQRLEQIGAREGQEISLAASESGLGREERIVVTDGTGRLLSQPWGVSLSSQGENSQGPLAQAIRIQERYPQLEEFIEANRDVDQVEFVRIGHSQNSLDHEGLFVMAPFGPPHSLRHLGIGIVAPFSYLQEKATSGNQQIVQATVFLGAGSSLIAFLAVTWLLRRLKPLAVSATKIASGDYDVPLPPYSGDEIGELTLAFGEMTRQVQGREEYLDTEVKRRTKALQNAHDALSAHSEALKKTNVELAVARDRALEAGRAKSEFFAKMSHELKSPLTVIILAAESLEEEAEETEGAEDLVPEIRDILVAAWTLYEQITSILDISKIEAGKLEVHLADFDLREVIESEIQRPIRYLAARKNNAFEVCIDPQVRSLHSDRTLVKNALYNLLSNACKFTEKGTVRLEVAEVEEVDRRWTLFRVSDSGIGMSESQLAKIFKVFSQVDASTSSKYGGHGLGLANVRNYCEILGGEVTVESEPGKGSVFQIKIPTRCAGIPKLPIRPIEEGLLVPPPEVQAKTVLVVDDDQRWRENMLRVLTREGFHVVTASSGEEGLKHARLVKPAVITLDVSMPTMDGWTVLAELKSDPELASIPVVMVTLVDNQKVAYRLGAEDYLTKPVDRSRLIQVLRKHLKEKAADPVLVIEDDQAVRELLRSTLEREGWEVSVAKNGFEGLESMDQKTPALILLDLLMPEMDGFEFIDRIREREDWASVPVVVITALNLTEEDRERLRGHAETIFHKGDYTEEDLLREIQHLASLHGEHVAILSSEGNEQESGR